MRTRSAEGNGARIAVLAAMLLAAVALTSGCRDDLASPTQGFIEVDTRGVVGVAVFLDGAAQGTDPGRLGPLDAGTYVVTVARDGFEATPATGESVEVVPARTAVARFTLVPRAFGSAAVSATDELTGDAVVGARIFQRDPVSGALTDTGVTTPGVVGELPIGPATFVLRSAGRVHEPETTIAIEEDVETPVALEFRAPRGVLAEMFTYYTCPNCPPAAEALDDEHLARPLEVFVIEWHSGFPGQPFYDARWRAREEYYEALAAGPIIDSYPAVLFQGALPWIEGGSISETGQYDDRVIEELGDCGTDCPLAIGGEAAFSEETPNAASAAVTVRAKWRGGSLPGGDLTLRVVLLGSGFMVGDTPFNFVPFDLAEEVVTFGTPGEVLERTYDLAATSTRPFPAWTWVAYVQAESTGEILAVTGSHE